MSYQSYGFSRRALTIAQGVNTVRKSLYVYISNDPEDKY